MISINPEHHMYNVSRIIQSRYLVVFIFVLALGMGVLPWFQVLFDWLMKLFLYLFPLYLLFTLVINDKRVWAVGLVGWMGLSLVPMQAGSEINYLQYLYESLPLLFLIIYCMMLNFRLKHWGYPQQGGDFPLWF